MGYLQRSLADGEHVVYQTKTHPVIFVWPLVVFLTSFAAFVSGFAVVAWIFLALGLGAAFVIFQIYRRSDFAVTNRRVLGEIGGYRPRRVEVSLIELRDAEFKRGMLGGLFAYGTVVITDRQGAAYKFSCVPAQFFKHVQARDERVRRILR